MPSHLTDAWLKWSQEVTNLQNINITRFLGARIEKAIFDRKPISLPTQANQRMDRSLTHQCWILQETGVVQSCSLIKKVTLAQLEPMPALLMERMHRYLSSNYDTSFSKVTVWSNSQITLCWIGRKRLHERPLSVNGWQKSASLQVFQVGTSALARTI